MKHVEVVCAVIKNNEGKIFCCKRGPGRALENYWEFPGGKVEAQETHEETIIREIKEELSSTIKPLKYIGVSNHVYSDLEKPFSITMYGYICELVEGDLTLSEHIDSCWLLPTELDSLMWSPADIPFVNKLIDK